MTREIKVTIDNEEAERKLKLLRIWKNAGQHEAYEIKSDEELIKLLIDEATGQMKMDPVGRKLFW